jgi:hypothetical protein
MSSVVGSRSVPEREFASACGYHVLAAGAAVKSRWTVVAPVAASSAELASQVSASISTCTRIGTALDRWPPHIAVARWKTANRAAPSVVAALPPIGVTAVGSLRP